MALLDDVKAACNIAPSISAYDNELSDLILAGFADIGITDVRSDLLTEENAPILIRNAIKTYCKMNRGQPDDGFYDKLKASYDEQKAQLLMSSEYTDWGDSNA